MLLIGLDAASDYAKFGYAVGSYDRGPVLIKQAGLVGATGKGNAIISIIAPELRETSGTFFGDAPRIPADPLAMSGCPDKQFNKVELALRSVRRYDTSTDRSVQGSLPVAKQDLEVWLYQVPNVMDLDPFAVSCRLNERPATIYGKVLWLRKAMLEAVAHL